MCHIHPVWNVAVCNCFYWIQSIASTDNISSTFFIRTTELMEKSSGGYLVELCTSQNCLWATSVHHHNVEIYFKNHFSGTLCVYVCVYTYISAIICTDGASEKSYRARRYQNWTSATSVSALNVLKVGLWESYAIDVTQTAKQVG